MFLHLWLLELQVLSILYREVNVLQHDVNTFLVSAVKRQESHHAVVINLDTQTATASLQTLIQNQTENHTHGFTHQTTDGLSQLLKLCASNGVRVIFHLRVHVWVQVPGGHERQT